MDESPQSAVVVPGKDGILRIDHATPPPDVAAAAVPVAEPVVLEAPQPAPMPQPQYSQLTPVYAPTPFNTPVDIAQPAVKGVEFVMPMPPNVPVLAADSAYAPPPFVPIVEQPAPVVVTPEPGQPTLDSAPLLPITSPGSITDPGMVQALPTPNAQDYEQSIQSMDIDTMVSGLSDVTAEYVAPPAPVPQLYQAPTPTQSFTTPALPPVQPVAVNPVANYFQSMPTAATAIMPVAVNASSGGVWSRFKVPIIIAAGVIVLGLGAWGVSAIVNNQNIAVTPAPIEAPAIEAPVVEPPVIQAPVGLAPDPSETLVEQPPVVIEPPAPVPIRQTPTSVNTAAGDDDAHRPEKLTIAALGIKAPLQSVNLTTTGTIEIPTSVSSAGWYSSSVQPGTTGAVLIDGHSAGRQNQLFQNLQTLKAGNTISVKRLDGRTISYRVSKVSVVNRTAVSMTTLLKPYGNASRGLNIISATGPWVTADQTQRDRVIVYAIEK